MLSPARIAIRQAGLRGYRLRTSVVSIRAASSSPWASVQQGPPVRDAMTTL